MFDRVNAPVFSPRNADWTPPSIPIDVSFGVTKVEDRLAAQDMAMREAAFHRQERLKFTRRNKLIVVQHTKLNIVQRNKLN